MKKHNFITPEGMRDFIFEECAARRETENLLMNLFREEGFHEVITPLMEYYDVFDPYARFFPMEKVYNLNDYKGRVITVRPDSTLPIIRLAETRLKDEPRPLKLCYNQTIYRAHTKEAGRDDEIAQSGVELIGGSGGDAVLRLAMKALSVIGGTHFEVGDCNIFNELVKKYNIDTENAEQIRRFVEDKNIPALSAMNIPEIFKKLPKLFGGGEVFGEFAKLEDTGITDYLRTIFEGLKENPEDGRNLESVTVDLGLTNKRDYYTGVLFRGYIDGYGKALISGGRYKIGNTEGEGFAVNVNAAAEVAAKGGCCR